MQQISVNWLRTMYELTKAWEWVPRRGIPNNFPAATLLLAHMKKANYETAKLHKSKGQKQQIHKTKKKKKAKEWVQGSLCRPSISSMVICI